MYLSLFVVIKNIVDIFSHMVWWAFIVIIDINPIESCAQVNDLHSTEYIFIKGVSLEKTDINCINYITQIIIIW